LLLSILGTPLWCLYCAFYYLTSSFIDFNTWLTWAAGRINQILDITTITSYFQTWINYAINAYNWVYLHFYNVVSDVTTWWSASNNPIRLYIDQAISTIQGLPDWFMSEFTSFKLAWDNFWSYTFPQWMASLQSLWNSFTTFVASIGQTILSHLNAFWDSTIFPALESIWQALAALQFPSWDEIWSFIFSKLPGIDDILNWWSETWTDVKDFFAEPTAWLLKRFSGDIFYSFLTPFIEDAGGTKEARDEAWKNIKPAEEEGDENLIILKDETLTQATIQGGMIEEETEKIKARIYGELG